MNTLITCNPVTKETIKTFDITPVYKLDSVFDKADDAFKIWSKTNFDMRFDIIQKFTELLKARKETLATLISNETGKVLWDSESEVDAAIAKMSHALNAVKSRTPLEIYKPIGIMGVLGAYNFPFHLPNGHIIPALFSGNVVIFKPSDKTPAVAHLMAQLWQQAGLPDNVLQVIYGFSDLGSALVQHEKINGVLFTGGETAGLAIHKALAGRPEVMLALEMGGNNPLVIWNPDDIQTAAQIAVYSAFISSGQRCTCTRRLIIPENSADIMINYLIDITKKLVIDTPFAPTNPFYSSLIDDDAVLRANQAINGIVSCDARILYQGHTDKGNSFIAPIILDVTDCDVPDDEIFAPVLQVIRVADFDNAIAQANKTRFGLSAGLISNNDMLWGHFKDSIKAGIINYNAPTVGAAGNAPFGGVGRSGNYRPAGFYAADYCAYPTASVIKPTAETILDRFL
jgi:succinylglutamic semialdehyde dehydrogenase